MRRSDGARDSTCAAVGGPAALERLEKVTTIVVDKTGTLTEGKPSLQRVVAAGGFTEDEVLRLASAVEAVSEHPLARSIVSGAAGRGLEKREVADFDSDPGLGVRGMVDERRVLVGNRRLMERHDVIIDELSLVENTRKLRENSDVF